MTKLPHFARALRSALLLSLAGSVFTHGLAFAQQPGGGAYPVRPLRFVVNFPAGGSVDLVARLVGQGLVESMGQQVIVDNRPGAGGNIGAEIVAKSSPDGYTVLVTLDTTMTVNPTLYRKLSFDPLKDFAPVTQAVSSMMVVVVHPSLPAKSLKEFIALAKAKPKQLVFASAGNGSPPHLAAVMLSSAAGIDLIHVPYKGSPPAVVDLVAGQAQVSMPSLGVALPMIKADRLRPLAVTGGTRAAGFPALPTIAESGYPGYELLFWIGFFAPTGTPNPVVKTLQEEINKAMRKASVKEILAVQMFDIVGNSPGEFGVLVRHELNRLSKVVKESGARID